MPIKKSYQNMQLQIRISKEIKEQIKIVADANHMSISEYVRFLILEDIRRHQKAVNYMHIENALDRAANCDDDDYSPSDYTPSRNQSRENQTKLLGVIEGYCLAVDDFLDRDHGHTQTKISKRSSGTNREENDKMTLIYRDKETGKVYPIKHILTNHSMTIDEALGDFDMDAWADKLGWDGWDYECLDTDYSDTADKRLTLYRCEDRGHYYNGELRTGGIGTYWIDYIDGDMHAETGTLYEYQSDDPDLSSIDLSDDEIDSIIEHEL